jgi:hypothetical protein
MSLLAFLIRFSLAVFLGITAYQNLQNLGESSKRLSDNYLTFQKTFTSRTGLGFHEKLSHSFLNQHVECVTKYLSYAILGLSVLSLLVCRMFTPLLGLVYFLEQTVHLNFAKLTHVSKLEEYQEFSLAVFILLTCMMVGCCGSNNSCRAVKPKRH